MTYFQNRSYFASQQNRFGSSLSVLPCRGRRTVCLQKHTIATDGWLTTAQICLNGDRSPKWRRSASLARVSNGVVPPSEPVDIDPKRIFRDHPERVRRPEYNADSTDEALAFDHRAGFQDPFFPPNLEGIFGGPHDLGHCDRGGAPSDFREGTFITGIIIEHLGSAGSHMIERVEPICAHNDRIDRQGSDILDEARHDVRYLRIGGRGGLHLREDR